MAYPSGPIFYYPPKPGAAFALTLTGGIFIFLGALFEFLVLGAVFPFIGQGPGYWFTVLLGLAIGPAIILLAASFYNDPRHGAFYGTLILVLSIFSFFSAAGGFFIGLVLGVVGGILVLTWQPPRLMAGYYPVFASVPSHRTCPKCGRAVPSDSRYCSYCGAVLG